MTLANTELFPHEPDLEKYGCRYCANLVDVRPKGTPDYIGACRFQLTPPCDKWELMEAMKA